MICRMLRSVRWILAVGAGKCVRVFIVILKFLSVVIFRGLLIGE